MSDTGAPAAATPAVVTHDLHASCCPELAAVLSSVLALRLADAEGAGVDLTPGRPTESNTSSTARKRLGNLTGCRSVALLSITLWWVSQTFSEVARSTPERWRRLAS
jgi:hypothetical protein